VIALARKFARRHPFVTALAITSILGLMEISEYVSEAGFARERGLTFVAVTTAGTLSLFWAAFVMFAKGEGPRGKLWEKVAANFLLGSAICFYSVVSYHWAAWARK